MERLLSEIVERLQKAHRDKLVSVILYGSGALPDGRDCLSDYNILCVLSRVTPEELAEAEPVFRWWREMKNPSPLLMCVDEVRSSADSFPIEFHDMREQHAVLWGEDVVRDLDFDTSYYRLTCEHELRAKLLRLATEGRGCAFRSGTADPADGELYFDILCTVPACADPRRRFAPVRKAGSDRGGAGAFWNRRERVRYPARSAGRNSSPSQREGPCWLCWEGI